MVVWNEIYMCTDVFLVGQLEEERLCEGRDVAVRSGAEWKGDKKRIPAQTGEYGHYNYEWIFLNEPSIKRG